MIDVVITEGEPDSLCGLSHGIPCITQTGGAGTWKPEFNVRFRDLNVLIAYDNDVQGQAGAERVATSLLSVASSVSIVIWPPFMAPKQDLSDYLVTHSNTAEDFWNLERKEVRQKISGLDTLTQFPDGLPEKSGSLRNPQAAELSREEIEEILKEIEPLLEKATEGDADAPFDAVPYLSKLPKNVEMKWRRRFKDVLGDRLNMNNFGEAINERRRGPKKDAPQYDFSHAEGAIIQVNERQLRQLTKEALDALYKYNDPPFVFLRSGYPVSVFTDEIGRPSIMSVTESFLRGLLTRSAHWFRDSHFGPVDVFPPMDVVRDILAQPDLKLPPLKTIIETPTIRPDGTILHLPGYDPTTGLFFCNTDDLSLPNIPEKPSREDAKTSLSYILDEVLCDFPFADEASQANGLGLLVTPVLRHLIDGLIPLALVDAPQAGTGKSFLAEVVSTIATGRTAPMTTAPEGFRGDDDSEWRKRITSLLLLGESVVVIDNVDGVLKAPSLAAALTSETWSDRLLGKNQMVVLPQNAAWIATGNNLKLGGDLPRRCYWIRLNAKRAKPFQRTGYRHQDLLGWIRSNRGTIISALLTMARGWFVAGKPEPDNVPIIGGFQNWVRIIAGILHFAGVDRFLGNIEELYDQSDDEEKQWASFLEVWSNIFGDSYVTVNEIAEVISRPVDEYTPKGEAGKTRMLRETLPPQLSVALNKSAPAFKQALGNSLSKNVDTHFANGIHIKRGYDNHKKVATWRICGACEDTRKPFQLLDFVGEKGQLAGPAGASSSPSCEPPHTTLAGTGGKGGEERTNKDSVPAGPADDEKAKQKQPVEPAGARSCRPRRESAPTCETLDQDDDLHEVII